MSVNFKLPENKEINSSLSISYRVEANGFSGDVVVKNLKLISDSDVDTPSQPTELITEWNFEDGVQGWKYDDSWKGSANISGSHEHDSANERLKVNLDYSKETDTENAKWMQVGISIESTDGFDFDGNNLFSFDFYYQPSLMSEGDICIKPDAEAENSEAKKMNISKGDSPSVKELTQSDATPSGFKKVTYRFRLNEDSVKSIKPKKIMLVIVGRNTAYNGVVYFDNIKLSKVLPEQVTVWDFAKEKGNWTYDNNDWKDEKIDFTGSVEYDSAGQRLKANIDFSNL